jgi:hypothetical protein
MPSSSPHLQPAVLALDGYLAQAVRDRGTHGRVWMPQAQGTRQVAAERHRSGFWGLRRDIVSDDTQGPAGPGLPAASGPSWRSSSQGRAPP